MMNKKRQGPSIIDAMKPLFYFDVDRKLLEEDDGDQLDEESLHQINMQIA